jgi:hypothetical protein
VSAVRARRLGPSQQRAQPRLELLQGERLDQVVVRARVEPGHAIVDRVARRQHQHRRPIARVAQSPAHLQPVDPGHRDIEDHRVLARVRQPVQRLAPVRGQRDVVAVKPQRTVQSGPHGGFVVDDEDALVRCGFRCHQSKIGS